GTVDPRRLILDDPRFAFGVRLDEEGVLGRVFSVLRERSVVLVEASDLARADRYRPYASEAEQRRQRDLAVGASNSLFGQLLGQIDLSRDLVVLLGPAHSQDGVTLTPLAIQGPGFTPGLLTSATTRRSGFVQIQDVAPTILGALGVDAPTSMEGNATENGRVGGSAADRLELLCDADAAAQFRDDRVGEVYALLVAAVAGTGALLFVVGAAARAA